MKKFLVFILLITNFLHASISNPQTVQNEQEQPLQCTFSVAAKKFSKVKLLLGIVGLHDQSFENVITILKKDLEFSGQFDVTMRNLNPINSKQEFEPLSQEGFSLVIFLNPSDDNKAIEWRMYDTHQVAMIKGSKYTLRGCVARGWAHNLADSLWNVLTGQDGFFSTKIAYAKDIPSARKRKIKHLYIADYDGSNEQLLVSMPTVNVAPRWNNDPNMPLLFYSEYTNSNVRLIAVSMQKQRKIASNFDGINMCPAFSNNGKQVIYCASKGKGNCQLYYYEKGLLKQITHNKGNNVSPTFSHDGKKVFFCSDFQTGQPQVYCYDIETSSLDRLTQGGYCASPSYCPKQNKVAYSKIVKGTMQLFVCDLDTHQHKQLTFDKGHKEECSWSPCGNFVLFAEENKDKSRIAMLNLVTNHRQYVTPEKQVCTYPAWSPSFEQFPVVA